MSLEATVRQAQQGNKEAFVSLIKELEASLYRVAKSMLRADFECADAIQETILRAYNGLPGLREPKYFKTWLIRILINECNKILSAKRKVVPISEFDEQADSTPSHDQNIVLQDAVAALSEDYRTVITLFYFEDLPMKEIADLLEISESTVKIRLFRAKSKLAVLLGDSDKEEGLS